MQLVFLLEERSMRPVVEQMCLVLVPQAIDVVILVHQGKQDLQKSIPRKLQAWQYPDALFIVLHDQDSHDCKRLKQELLALCPSHKRAHTLIRIVCTELESWFFGDLMAVEKAFPAKVLRPLARSAKYRNPDAIRHPAKELEKFIPEYQKVAGARAIAPFLGMENTSASFQVFVEGVRGFVQKLRPEG
jgi:Domain of unknown function (DUF4276)